MDLAPVEIGAAAVPFAALAAAAAAAASALATGCMAFGGTGLAATGASAGLTTAIACMTAADAAGAGAGAALRAAGTVAVAAGVVAAAVGRLRSPRDSIGPAAVERNMKTPAARMMACCLVKSCAMAVKPRLLTISTKGLPGVSSSEGGWPQTHAIAATMPKSRAPRTILASVLAHPRTGSEFGGIDAADSDAATVTVLLCCWGWHAEAGQLIAGWLGNWVNLRPLRLGRRCPATLRPCVAGAVGVIRCVTIIRLQNPMEATN